MSAYKYLTNEPQVIREQDWYYEGRKGLEFIHQVYDLQGNYLKTDHILVPWKLLQASFERYREYKIAAYETECRKYRRALRKPAGVVRHVKKTTKEKTTKAQF